MLCHHDLPRAARAVESAVMQWPSTIKWEVLVVVNTQNAAFERAMVDWVERYDRQQSGVEISVLATYSDGTPATGKNSLGDEFLAMAGNQEYLLALDGDDILYPTAMQSVEWHLKRMPTIDLLSTIPIDSIGAKAGYHWHNNGVDCGIWADNLACPYHLGPMKSHMWDKDLPMTPVRMMLYSRRQLASGLRFDPELGVGEDHLYMLASLGRYQRGELLLGQTMAIDMWACDRTTPDSVQRVVPQRDHVQKLKEKAMGVVPMPRSWIGEVPMYWPESRMSLAQRKSHIDWAVDYARQFGVG